MSVTTYQHNLFFQLSAEADECPGNTLDDTKIYSVILSIFAG